MSKSGLRVLLTADPFLPVPPPLYGGIERIIHGLAQELRARGHIVGLLAHPESTSDVDYRRAWPSEDSSGAGNVLRHTAAIARSVREFRPDVLHSFSRLMLMLPLLGGRFAKLMSYQRDTGGWRNRVAAIAGGRKFAFTACSEFIAAKGRRFGGTWHAIHNFVDTSYYALGGADGDAPLVFLSRVERIKGAHGAIAIAKGARRRLVIAGNRVDSVEGRDYWAREIEPHIDGSQITYVGAVDDAQKKALLANAAAMVVPIEWDEPFGIVFAEALACGAPVISSPRGALPEIVREGVTGFLVRSVDEGIAAVHRLSGISRATCRRDAEERFSQTAAGTAYIAAYLALLGQRRA
jgi:glycosyltransferase involved in cell wall biosynthesis